MRRTARAVEPGSASSSGPGDRGHAAGLTAGATAVALRIGYVLVGERVKGSHPRDFAPY